MEKQQPCLQSYPFIAFFAAAFPFGVYGYFFPETYGNSNLLVCWLPDGLSLFSYLSEEFGKRITRYAFLYPADGSASFFIVNIVAYFFRPFL